jgi:carboxymethylenebutenolidase
MTRASVEIATLDGLTDTYLGRPDDRPHPGVLFIMDVFGLRPTIYEMADRIAADGYVVLAPNVFYRVGRSLVLPMPNLADPEQRTSFWQAGAALACFHTGGLVTDAPDSPHRSAANLKAELYFGFADQDPSMTAEQIATLEWTLQETGVRYRAEVYAGARHGYTMADQDTYDPVARERHFRELRALLSGRSGRPRG